MVSARLTINSVRRAVCAAQTARTTVKLLQHQYGGVSGAEPHIDGLAGSSEVWKIPPAVHQVGAEQAAEEHYFGARKTHIPSRRSYAAAPRWRSDGATAGLCAAWASPVALVHSDCGVGVILQQAPPLCEARLCRVSPVPRSCRLPKSRWVFVKIEGRRRRSCFPFESGGVPWIIGCGLAVNASTTGNKPWAASIRRRELWLPRWRERSRSGTSGMWL